MAKTLSTSKVARLIGVGVASVVNWINQGQMKAGRTPGGHRRVAVEDLIEFLRRHNLPIPQELTHSAPRVLVVDDEPSVRKWIRDVIEEKHPDYEVKEAKDGFSAGELVGAWKPDVVILDLRMPGMDGLEVCSQIKAREDARNTAVIAISAYYSPKAEREILKCGARVCLEKPLQLEILLKELEAALRR
jgi:excisionase family DNA binding protein